MKLCCGLMDGQLWDATLQPSPEGGFEGGQVLVLSNEEILSQENVEFGEFTIMEATAEERAALIRAGYSVPDWTPGQARACVSCPTGGYEQNDESAGSQEKKE